MDLNIGRPPLGAGIALRFIKIPGDEGLVKVAVLIVGTVCSDIFHDDGRLTVKQPCRPPNPTTMGKYVEFQRSNNLVHE